MNQREILPAKAKQPLSEEALAALREGGHSEDAIAFAAARLATKERVSAPLQLARKIIAEDWRAAPDTPRRRGCPECDWTSWVFVDDDPDNNTVTPCECRGAA